MMNALNALVMPQLQGAAPQGLVGIARPQGAFDPQTLHTQQGRETYLNSLLTPHFPVHPDDPMSPHGSGINGPGHTIGRIGRFAGQPGGGMPGVPSVPGQPQRVNGGYGFTNPADMIGATYNITGASAPANPYQLPTYTPGG